MRSFKRYKAVFLLLIFLGATGFIVAKIKRHKKLFISLPQSLKEEMVDVIEYTKEIHLPGVLGPVANPGVIGVDNGYLLAFRAKDVNLKTFLLRKLGRKRQYIGLVFLNKNFDPVSKITATCESYLGQMVKSAQEDPRLIQVQDKIYMIYSDKSRYLSHRERVVRGVYLREVIIEKDHKITLKKPIPLYFPKSEIYTDLSKKDWIRWDFEKNWTPFVHEGQLYLIYWLSPYIVIKPDLISGVCEEVFIEVNMPQPFTELSPKGGTPAIVYKEHLLSFFHSRVFLNKKSSSEAIYCMGAYLLDKEPPFKIAFYTPCFLTGKGLYDSHRKIIFPTGLVYTEEGLFLFYGRDNEKIFVSKICEHTLKEEFIDIKEGL